MTLIQIVQTAAEQIVGGSLIRITTRLVEKGLLDLNERLTEFREFACRRGKRVRISASHAVKQQVQIQH